ncbi:hypothetical protein BDV29DRAFT_175435 [Aspergillus leporis]|uniref:Uncharacterized protein n=1 Tax=Aspergillus leporis TaxID=41062 RepID=A0A5N5WY24_9EURO|nr:hypothetical protein BDV29DRAFT_175435 [Aspergillus leporis]
MNHESDPTVEARINFGYQWILPVLVGQYSVWLVNGREKEKRSKDTTLLRTTLV